MSTYEFVAELTRSLAWPAVVAALVLLLRRPIGAFLQELLPYIEKLRIKDFELFLRQRITEVESSAAAIERVGDEPPIDTAILQKIDISPRNGVIEAWLAVETELADIAIAHDVRGASGSRGGVTRWMAELSKRGVLSDELVTVIRELRDVRNRAAHDLEFDLYPELAERYATVAGHTTAVLRRLK